MELEGMLAVKPEKCENCPLLEACSKSGEKSGKKGKASGVSKSITCISGQRLGLVAASVVGPHELGLGQMIRPWFYSKAAQEQRFEQSPGFSSPRLVP